MKMRALSAALVLLLLLPLAACRRGPTAGAPGGKIRVVTTLFPLYDFAREVGGDRVAVTLLLPPGVEPHSFEPRPEDMVTVSDAALFVFTNRYMEPWVDRFLAGIDGKRLTVVDASTGVTFLPATPGEEEGEDGHGERMDPHIWLSIPNAQRMVANIAAALEERDPSHRDYYRKNAAAYEQKLADLDKRFREGLASCRTRTFLHGGHYAFGYLAARYGLTYRAAYSLSASAEPRPRQITDLIGEMRREKLTYIFYEELLSPRVAETIARESGARLLKLNAVHNVTRDEMAAGATYISLMEENLTNLRMGLQCR